MKRNIAIIILLAVAVIAVMALSSCGEYQDSAAEKEAAATEKALQEQIATVGMPAIKNWQEKKLAKMIFELRDQENLVTYAYIVNLNGQLVFIGKCIGYGLPYSTQYTNPMATQSYSSGGYEILPQADPNGLYMPEGLSATWLMLIDPKTGDPRPVYIEPEIIVSPFPLH